MSECSSSDQHPTPRHIIRGPTSEVTREFVDGRTVYIKQYLVGDWGRSLEVICARAERELSLLNRLAASNVFRRHLGLLQVIDAHPQRARIVTAEVKGEPLFDLLTRCSRQKRPAASSGCHRALYLAGKWLKRFQSIEVNAQDSKTIGDYDPRGLVEYCDIRLQKLQQSRPTLFGAWPPDSVRRSIQNRLERLVAASSDDDRRYVWAHGDYGPWNILWDGAVLTPLDFQMVLVEQPLLDVTYFIHRLEMQQIYRPWLRWPMARWKRTFLKGYGRPDAENSPMYRAQMIRHLLCRLLTYVLQKPAHRKQQLHNAWVRQQVKKRLRRELRLARWAASDRARQQVVHQPYFNRQS